MWTKYVTRRIGVQTSQAWNFGFGKAMEEVYGVSIPDILVYRDRQKTDYYVDAGQFEKYQNGLDKLLNDGKFIKNFCVRTLNTLKKIYSDNKKELRRDLSKLSNRSLLKLHKNLILHNQSQFYVNMWMPFNLGKPLPVFISDILRSKNVAEKKIDVYLLKLSTPLKPNDVINERIDLLKLLSTKKRTSRIKFLQRIKLHAQKFRHLPMFDYDHLPYEIDHFFQEIKSVRDPQKELKEISAQFRQHQSEYKNIISELNLDLKQKQLMKFLKDNVWLRDYRDRLRQKNNLELRKLYLEIGQRLGLDIEQVNLLVNEEIIKYLSAGHKFPLDIIKQRESAFLLIQHNDQTKIYSGKFAVKQARKFLVNEKINKTKIIHGLTGSPGKVTGRVKIVYTNKDLYKVNKNDILVAAMTRQDFVPAIRKVRAIVTDEGSITCHAAIIARELKKPCIVGTKIATKVFKDGDLVEVNANKGIVKLIKRKK
jgi:phosphohistidine swiveling domain-containing protein